MAMVIMQLKRKLWYPGSWWRTLRIPVRKKGIEKNLKRGLTFAQMPHLPVPQPTGTSFLHRLGYPFLYEGDFRFLRQSFRGCYDSEKMKINIRLDSDVGKPVNYLTLKLYEIWQNYPIKGTSIVGYLTEVFL